MRYEKKEISKEDGRYLIFYHFRETASVEQIVAFESVDSLAAGAVSSPDGVNSTPPKAPGAGTKGTR